MLKILATWSHVTWSLALRTRRLEFAAAARSRFTVIFNRIHTTNSNDLSEKKDALGNGKRKRDNSTEPVR